MLLPWGLLLKNWVREITALNGFPPRLLQVGALVLALRQRAGCSQDLGHNTSWGESAVLAKKGQKIQYFSSGALAAGRSPSVPQGES